MATRTTATGLVIGALGLAASACGGTSATTRGTAQPIAADAGTRTLDVHVETHPSQGAQRVIEGARASLSAGPDGLGVRLDTRELTPGHVYTLWVVAINAPEACAASPCTPQDVLANSDGVEADVTWGAGTVADASGHAVLSAWLPAGRWAKSWFGHGYMDTEEAEIHAILNDHGPAMPQRLATMLTTVRDGCTDGSVPPAFPDTAKRDGVAGPNACALVQDAIFLEGR